MRGGRDTSLVAIAEDGIAVLEIELEQVPVAPPLTSVIFQN